MFMYIRALARLTRVKAYLLTLFSIIALISLISPQDLLSVKTVVVFFANLFLTAFIYAFNDVEDAVDDYHILEKRKRNPIANGDLSKTGGYLISFFLLSLGMLLLSLVGPMVFFFGSVLAVVGFLYSWKPVRLKSMPFVDLVSHVLCLGVLQFFITYLTFRSIDFLIIPFLMIILPFSLMVQVLYELRDFEVDRRTNVTNTIQRLGRFDTKRLLIACGAIAVIGFAVIFMFLAIPPEFEIVIFFSSLFLAFVLASRVNRFLKTYFAKDSNED